MFFFFQLMVYLFYFPVYRYVFPLSFIIDVRAFNYWTYFNYFTILPATRATDILTAG